MFNAYVLQIPTYIIMSKLGWIDTYLALMVPAFALPMGLFLMKTVHGADSGCADRSSKD